MGLWHDHVVPRIVDKALSGPVQEEIRARACAGLRGDVLEVGFGSGRNLPHLPPAVTSLAAVEPSGGGYRLAAGRIAASPVPVRLAGLDGQRLDADDASFDTALSTWTLCTIPDASAALREVRRVLRPGGTLHFADHGLSDEPAVAVWQRRLDPLHQRIAGGCDLTRPIDALLTDAGFAIERLDRYRMAKTPRPWGTMYEGVAVRTS